MQIVFPLLAGILLGVLVTWWCLSSAYHHAFRSYRSDDHYAPTVRAVSQHFRVQGTLNRRQVERMMDISGITALRYLDQMVHDGFIKRQGHRGSDTFYTLT